MEAGILGQLYSMFIFIISGIIIGIFFDIFRILRKSFHTSDIITYIEDIIFWIITGIFLIFIIFKFTDGQIRLYNIAGLICGCTIYMIFISKFFIKIHVKILLFVKKVISSIFEIVLIPFSFIAKILQKMFKPFTFFVINIKNILFNFKKSKKKPKKRRILNTNVEKYN